MTDTIITVSFVLEGNTTPPCNGDKDNELYCIKSLLICLNGYNYLEYAKDL